HGVDSVIVSFTPSAGASEQEIAEALSEQAAQARQTTIACFSGVQGVRDELTAFVPGAEGAPESRTVPSYFGPEDAVIALARTTDYAMWRGEDHGHYPELAGIDRRAARSVIDGALEEEEDDGTVVRTPSRTRWLVHAYGICDLPHSSTSTVDEALAAADELGYPVSLKAVHTRLRHRMELGGVRLNIETPEELRDGYAQIRGIIEEFTAEGPYDVDVQRMAPPGTACVVRGGEDPLLGPVVSFSLSGD